MATAGRPASQRSESGQVRKEAATAIYCECRGSGSPPFEAVARRMSVSGRIVPTVTMGTVMVRDAAQSFRRKRDDAGKISK